MYITYHLILYEYVIFFSETRLIEIMDHVYDDSDKDVSIPFLLQFSEPQIEYPLGGSSKKGSHVYFLLQVFWVILLFDINFVLMLPW